MNHHSYVVRFYKKPEKRGDKPEFLGQVEITDHGVSQNFTLHAKAFRQAPPKCAYANKIEMQRI